MIDVTEEERTWFERERQKTATATERILADGRARFFLVSLVPFTGFVAFLVFASAVQNNSEKLVKGLVVLFAGTYILWRQTSTRWKRLPEEIGRLRSLDLVRWRLRRFSLIRIDPDENLLLFVWLACCGAGICSALTQDKTVRAVGLMLAIAGMVVPGWMGYRRVKSRPPHSMIGRPSLFNELAVPIIMEWASLGAAASVVNG